MLIPVLWLSPVRLCIKLSRTANYNFQSIFLTLTAMTKHQAPPHHPVPLHLKFRNKTNKLNTVLNNFIVIDDKLLILSERKSVTAQFAYCHSNLYVTQPLTALKIKSLVSSNITPDWLFNPLVTSKETFYSGPPHTSGAP